MLLYPSSRYIRALSAALAAAVFTSLSAFAAAGDSAPRLITPFDSHWRFLQADAADAEKPEFNDSPWRILDVPHDWSIEGEIRQENPTGKAGAFLPAGIGWYRKTFTLPSTNPESRVFIEFDGVMANSDVWINGHLLGHRPYGYVSFQYEITPFVERGEGKTNVISVKADNKDQPASRWYEGAGIYRHVRLVSTGSVHLNYNGVFVSTPQLSPEAATVRIQAQVTNQSDAPAHTTVLVSVFDPAGNLVASAETAAEDFAANASKPVHVEVQVKQPQHWDLESPAMYRAETEVRVEGRATDRASTAFGIRDFHFESATGFWVNGRNIKIKGVCLHQDGGGVGIAVPAGLWELRLKELKMLGVNAIRTAHNPMAPEFLDLCDRLGFLVLDEMFDCWTVGKNPHDYHLYFEKWSDVDTRDTVRRDRNHPSIFAYSAGNEIHDTPDAALAKRILGRLIQAFHEEDPTRPVTQALFRPNVSHDYDNGLADMLDVLGQNYRENEILAAHEQKPSRIILGTENRLDREMWLMLRDTPFYSGQFLWPGIAYLGESPGWPAISRPIGLLDRTGEPYPRAFERKSWWSEEPVVYAVRRIAPDQAGQIDPGYGQERRNRQVVFPDWTPNDLTPHAENVEVYSNAESIELLLNGTSLGSKPLPSNASPRLWKVEFATGTLEAVARNHGAEVARHKLVTAGKPARLIAQVDRSNPDLGAESVAIVRVSVVDTAGTLVPTANDLVAFSLEGPGRIVAVDNADSASHESFVGREHHAYQGRCIAAIRGLNPEAQSTVHVSAPGLEPASISIR